MGRSKLQIYGPNGEIYQPTLKLQSNTNPEKDAEELYQAMKGWETLNWMSLHPIFDIHFGTRTLVPFTSDVNLFYTNLCHDGYIQIILIGCITAN
uniref:Uncharacterized protein n=1 Tax=Schistosoma haematobium TaxID=6185 RepID=A0A095AT22_SCHHA